MAPQEFIQSIARLRFLVLLESVEADIVTKKVRESIADLKTATEDQLDCRVTPSLTVAQLNAIPSWDKDREIVSDIVTSYTADLILDAVEQCGIAVEDVTVEMLVLAAVVLDPIQVEVVNSLIPLH